MAPASKQPQNSLKKPGNCRETAQNSRKAAGIRPPSRYKMATMATPKKGGNAGLRPKKHTCANITTYSCRSGSDGRGPPNGAWRHRRITSLISNPKQRRISQLAHLASPLLCAARAPPCAWPHAPRPRDGCRVMPQRGYCSVMSSPPSPGSRTARSNRGCPALRCREMRAVRPHLYAAASG